ncbi:MAG: cyclic nucleotide-binding domain-containing protein [Candidatus Aminicenantes bacterium]|nr:cyclic nucleotide-binding domain-containing protein [Candidatus Aminicenantes bacterium]
MKGMNAFWGNIFKSSCNDARNTEQLLKKIPLFAGLGRGDLREIQNLAHCRHYRTDEVVFWEGEPGVGMYVLQRGEVGVFQDYGKGRQRELARLGPGDFFGEMALLENDFRSATAVALAETDLFGLIHPDLFDLFNRKPHLGVTILTALAGMLAQRLRRTNQDLQQMLGLPAGSGAPASAP